MADKTPKRYARKPEILLAALGFEVNRNNMAQFHAWCLHPDWPGKDGNKGWCIEKIDKFLEDHQLEFAQKASRAKFIGAENTPKSVTEKFSAVETFKSGEKSFPEYIDGMDNLGGQIVERFPEITVEVTRQEITNWKKGVGTLPFPPADRFPRPTRANRYLLKPVFAWVEKYVLPLYKGNQQAELLVTPGAVRAQIEQATLRRVLREEKLAEGNLMPYAAIKPYITGLADQFDKFYGHWFEEENGLRRVVKEQAKSAGAEAQLVSVLEARLALLLPQIVDGIKKEMRAAEAEALKGIEQERREQMEAAQ